MSWCFAWHRRSGGVCRSTGRGWIRRRPGCGRATCGGPWTQCGATSRRARRRWPRRRARIWRAGGRGYDGLRATLDALSPLNILERGYALVFDAQGNLVKDAHQVKPGNEIRARVSRGTIAATVKKTSD